MKYIKSLKYQLVLQFAIIILPMITIILFQTVSDMYHSEGLARSYHYLRACHGIKQKYTQFINGAVDAVDTGELGTGALLALDGAAENLRNLAQEDHTGNFIKIQEKMDHIFAALVNDRSITALVPLRQIINQVDAELGNEYLRYEKENRQAIEAYITFAKTQKKIVSGGIFITLLLSIMVGRLMTRSITRPITKAVAFAQSIILEVTEVTQDTTRPARDDSTSKVKAKATGEVQMLVDSINRMAEDLGKRSRELLEAQEELVRKEKLSVLGKLSGSVAHELRNPLGVMNNAVYFLRMVLAEADETTKEYLEIIRHEIGKSERIITDLLDFARTKAPHTSGVTPRQLIDESIGRCPVPENVVVRVDFPEPIPKVSVDPQQMGQVFQNLITNAIQAMPDGGALRVSARRVLSSEFGVLSSNLEAETLDPKPDTDEALTSELKLLGSNSKLKTQNSELDGDFVEISVADTGEGITPENMKKLFQPLFTTKAKGIGLGLVVCNNLVRANGGRIRVESRLGEGTTFAVMLPVISDET